MLRHDEEVKAGVASMVDECLLCNQDDFCENHTEEIQKFQQREEFDVTEYISKKVPKRLKEGERSDNE